MDNKCAEYMGSNPEANKNVESYTDGSKGVPENSWRLDSPVYFMDGPKIYCKDNKEIWEEIEGNKLRDECNKTFSKCSYQILPKVENKSIPSFIQSRWSRA